MMKSGRLKIVSALLCLPLVRGVAGEAEGGCPHPAVPAGAFYSNVTGGLGQESWEIKYKCDIGRLMV